MNTQKPRNKNQASPKETAQQRSKMMRMMGLCCGIPLLVIVTIAAFGFQSDNFGYLILLMCPIAMVFMMFMMRGQQDVDSCKPGQPCCPPTLTNKKPSDKDRQPAEVIKSSTGPKK